MFIFEQPVDTEVAQIYMHSDTFKTLANYFVNMGGMFWKN